MNREVASAVAVRVRAALYVSAETRWQPAVAQSTYPGVEPEGPVTVTDPLPPSTLDFCTASVCFRAKVTVTVVSDASEEIVQVFAAGVGRVQLLLNPTRVDPVVTTLPDAFSTSAVGVAVIVTDA